MSRRVTLVSRGGLVGGARRTTVTVSKSGPQGPAGSGGGSGDVVGPNSSVDGNVALFDGTTGKLLKEASGSFSGYTYLSGAGWTDDVPVLVPVKNTSGSIIGMGVPVYATGTVGDTSVIEVAPAKADDVAKMPAIGLTESQLSVNGTGYVVVVGTIRGVDTQTYTVNQSLYVSTTAGQLTDTKPTGVSELIQNIGRVTRVNQNSGEILVLGPGRTNDVPNAIDAGKLTSGTVATARLGTGTASASTYLRGDQSWGTPRASWFRVAFSDADYTVALSSSGFVSQVGTLTATRTVTLPSLASFAVGQELLVWTGAGVSGANRLVIAAAAGQTINGSSTFEVTQPNRLVRVVSNRGTSITSTDPSWVVDMGPTGWLSIADTTLAVDTASLSYDVTGYDQLHVIVSARSTRNSTSDNLNMTLNNDTSNVYSTNAAALTSVWTVGVLPAITTNTDRHQHVDIRLSLTDGYTKAGYSLRSTLFSTSTVGGAPTLTGLFSTLTGAVTSVELAGNLGDLAAGSRIRVLGMES